MFSVAGCLSVESLQEIDAHEAYAAAAALMAAIGDGEAYPMVLMMGYEYRNPESQPLTKPGRPAVAFPVVPERIIGNGLAKQWVVELVPNIAESNRLLVIHVNSQRAEQIGEISKTDLIVQPGLHIASFSDSADAAREAAANLSEWPRTPETPWIMGAMVLSKNNESTGAQWRLTVGQEGFSERLSFTTEAEAKNA